jgi:hypothetical protein
MPRDTEQLFIPAPVVIETDDVLRVLKEARQWLSDPAHWHKGGFAPNNNDNPQVAEATCAWGACSRAAGSDNFYDIGTDAENAAARLLSIQLGARPDDALAISDFNDLPDTTHDDVVALFDRAISARRAELAKEG